MRMCADASAQVIERLHGCTRAMRMCADASTQVIERLHGCTRAMRMCERLHGCTRVKIVSDRMGNLGDALNERASYDDVARSIIQVQTVFESLSDRVTELIARVDAIERSLVESQSNHPAIGGVNLKIEDLSTRMCHIDRMMQGAEQCWITNREGLKWVKDQLCETQSQIKGLQILHGQAEYS